MAKEDTGTTSAAEGKLKALQAAMSKIEKDFGKGSIMRMGDEQIENVEVIPTGSVALDTALGVGGYPRGRIIEIYGPESSGKTTLAIHATAESPMSPSISFFGVKAATESTTRMSIAEERISWSAISKACSPLSG